MRLVLMVAVWATSSAAQPPQADAFLILCIDQYGQNRDTWQINTSAKTVTLIFLDLVLQTVPYADSSQDIGWRIGPFFYLLNRYDLSMIVGGDTIKATLRYQCQRIQRQF